MKAHPVVLIVFLAFLFTACHNRWNDETKGAFSKACIQNYNEEVCDCALELLVEKYPDGKVPEDSVLAIEILRIADECNADDGTVK